VSDHYHMWPVVRSDTVYIPNKMILVFYNHFSDPQQSNEEPVSDLQDMERQLANTRTLFNPSLIKSFRRRDTCLAVWTCPPVCIKLIYIYLCRVTVSHGLLLLVTCHTSNILNSGTMIFFESSFVWPLYSPPQTQHMLLRHSSKRTLPDC
jgi:hypothetical protein